MKTYIKFNRLNPDGFQYWIEIHPDPSSENPIGRSIITWITEDDYQKMWDEGKILFEESVPGEVEIFRPVREWQAEQGSTGQVQVEVFRDAHQVLAIDDGNGIYHVKHPEVIDSSYSFEFDEVLSETRRRYTTQRRWLLAAIYGGRQYEVWKKMQAALEDRIEEQDLHFGQLRYGQVG